MGLYEVCFSYLSKRFLYGIVPNSKRITDMMKYYSSLKDLASLDMVYKCFSLLLYYHIPPTTEHYDILIQAGVDSALEEGVRRSLVTAKEQLDLGWPLSSDSLNSLKKGVDAFPVQDALYELGKP